MTLPNFLIIGAPRCGTTSLYAYLREHPQVFMAWPKEPRFFSYQGKAVAKGNWVVSDRAAYEELFAKAGTARAIGEASTDYLRTESVAERIKALIPDVRLVAVLRNPIERAYSAWLYDRRQGREQLDTVTAAVEAEMTRPPRAFGGSGTYVRAGLYATQLERYLGVFDRDQLRVYLFDDLVADPLRFTNDLCRFLDVDPRPSALARLNAAGVPRNALLQRGRRRIPKPIRAAARRWVPGLSQIARRSFERPNLQHAPKLTQEERIWLQRFFDDDIRRLENILDRDLQSLWMHPSRAR